ncbi:MAG TPA: universal stress protein [Longimicrobiaceae bacterium]|nr:universal stress protein [Longimicrobiaceae bacterium]
MSEPVRRILVGVADPDGSDPVLATALALAHAAGATLHAAYAFDLPAPVQSAFARAVSLDSTVLDRYGDELRRGLEAQVGARADGVPVVCHVVAGAASECICRLAREVAADLVVVGTTRRNWTWSRFLGATAEGVVWRAPVPVLVVTRPPGREVRRVLLTSDLSALSEEVHERGLDVVRAVFHPELPEVRCLLVVQDPELPFARSRETLEQVAQRELDRCLRERRPRGRAVQGKVRIGCPSAEILAEATDWQADLVLLGVQGRAASGPLRVGRVTGAVLRGAGRNVLVIPEPGHGVGARACPTPAGQVQ